MRVTLTIAEIADRAHMPTVSTNKPSVSLGVMVTGKTAFAVAFTISKPNTAAIENPMSALKKAWQRITWWI